MLRRLVTLFSSAREMSVIGYREKIVYYIPLKGEQIEWGVLRSIEMNDDRILVTFDRKTPPEESPDSELT